MKEGVDLVSMFGVEISRKEKIKLTRQELQYAIQYASFFYDAYFFKISIVYNMF